jgi:imidazolonepropionase-like amidohydrolase
VTIGATFSHLQPLVAGDELPGDRMEQAIALRGGTVHPISAPVIEQGIVVIRDGKIEAVGPAAEISVPDGADVVDTTDRHVYPSLIDSDTSIGLVEISAVRATVDMSEVGMINANAQAMTAFNPDSELIPVARADGILLALSVPRGQFVTGLSSLMQLDGWQADDMALKPIVGMHVQWPAATFVPSWFAEESQREQVKRRAERLRLLQDSLLDAAAYARSTSPAPNLRLEALAQVVQGEVPLMVHANGLREIQEAVAFAERMNVGLVIVGGYDAPHCAELLIEHNVPVIVTGTHRLPQRRNSPVHEPFTLPARLHQAGVKFCLAGFDRFSASAIRNLPQHAGTAAAHGLSVDEAVRAITLSPAEILGVADRVGSIEPGKDATLIVTRGDVLEVASQVEAGFIQGRPVDLDNRHKRLWRKYQEKQRRLVRDRSVHDRASSIATDPAP